MAKRDTEAAKWFFCKILKALPTNSPQIITVDKNVVYPKAIDELKKKKELPKKVKLRQKKCLNNIVEQDHRGIKRLVKSGMGAASFNTAQAFVKRVRDYEHGEERTNSRSCVHVQLPTGSNSLLKSLDWLHS